MAVEKISLSFEPQLAERIRAEAADAGLSVSAWVGRAAAREAKLAAARRAIADWEADHGAITDEEIAAVEAAWPA